MDPIFSTFIEYRVSSLEMSFLPLVEILLCNLKKIKVKQAGAELCQAQVKPSMFELQIDLGQPRFPELKNLSLLTLFINWVRWADFCPICFFE